MRTLMLDNVDDELALVLGRRARAKGLSIEQEATAVSREAIGEIGLSSVERVRRARAIVAMTPRPQLTDSLDLREERALSSSSMLPWQ